MSISTHAIFELHMSTFKLLSSSIIEMYIEKVELCRFLCKHHVLDITNIIFKFSMDNQVEHSFFCLFQDLLMSEERLERKPAAEKKE